MKNNVFLILLTIIVLSSCTSKKADTIENKKMAPEEKIVLVIHGGASYPTPGRNNPERDSLVKEAMKLALITGREVLRKGGSSTDAVQAAIKIMEDSPLFNAGKGAVFSSDGKNELDACIMQGKDLKAGSVCGITTVKNPISCARMVMDSSEFVMLAGKGAEQFAALKNLEIVDPSYFFTQVSWDELLAAKQKAKETMPEKPKVKNEKYGTVGAVALDKEGNLSAGTSTGGRTNKRWGRIGDSPIIGASTYADNRYCGVSSTGWGEFFIRNCVAHSVVSMIEYKNVNVKEAAEYVMYEKMKGIEGGIIALDPKGKVSIAFNTPVMNRGYITMDGEPQVFIYK